MIDGDDGSPNGGPAPAANFVGRPSQVGRETARVPRPRVAARRRMLLYQFNAGMLNAPVPTHNIDVTPDVSSWDCATLASIRLCGL
jgi:hypothetical protein